MSAVAVRGHCIDILRNMSPNIGTRIQRRAQWKLF